MSAANKAMEADANAIFFHGLDNGHLELHGYPCAITHAKTSYLKNSIAFSFQKNSPYRKLFSYHLLGMRQSGQIERLHIKHETYLTTIKTEHEKCLKTKSSFFPKCQPNEQNCVPAIKLETVWTSLLVLLVGSLAGFGITIFEWIEHHGYIRSLKYATNNILNSWPLQRRHIITSYSFVFIVSIILVAAILVYYYVKSKILHGDYEVWKKNDTVVEQFT